MDETTNRTCVEVANHVSGHESAAFCCEVDQSRLGAKDEVVQESVVWGHHRRAEPEQDSRQTWQWWGLCTEDQRGGWEQAHCVVMPHPVQGRSNPQKLGHLLTDVRRFAERPTPGAR